jgi:hypothetical protein
MSTERFENLTTAQLVVEFRIAAGDRGTAILEAETRRANKMFDKMQAIDRVLRSRGQDARMSYHPCLRIKIDRSDTMLQSICWAWFPIGPVV